MTEPSTELVEPAELVNPITGEIVRADDIDKIVEVVRDLKAHQDDVKTAQAAFGSILVEHSKTIGKRTMIAGGVKVEVSAPDEIEWDIDALHELRALGLPEARFDELVYADIEMKVNGNIARQLSGASEDYKRVIEGAKRRIPKRQYVTLK